ncbi:zinc-binding alcohol dehydrogenase family protein [Vallitalea maricola]|uniref:Zinc-binding alcohol dehydrogenase family protein n=1 Tax=Vallitalea maricola TaxID=3074433 RepID=A0ACB5UHK5_9FIRM|nr:zinc-binding alcohol dehydrogenase family protein [Vallitalea sp. AN17-2]
MFSIKVVEPYQTLVVDEPIPVISNPDEVLIKVTSGGICGSDIGIWNGTNALATYPRIIGHEFGGIIKGLGDGVKDFKVGDKVAVDPVVSCGSCYACTHDNHNVCDKLEVIGVHRDGGFREYITVNKSNVHLLKQEFDVSLLSLVEPYSIGYEINERGRTKKGENVLILGAGPIGITTMQVAKMKGANVIITDILPKRLDKAKEMGADFTVLVTNQDLNKEIKKTTGNDGIHVIVDTVCVPKTFEQCIQLADPGTRVVVIGLKNEPSNIKMVDITKKGIEIIGSRLNKKRFDDVIKGFESGQLHPEQLMTHQFDYTQILDALELITQHPEEVLKVVINF